MKKRGIIIARVSTKDQKDFGTSLEHQIERSEAYAHAHDIEIVGIFAEDYTGTTLDRPQLNEARAVLRSGRATVAIVYNADRLARDDWGSICYCLPEN